MADFKIGSMNSAYTLQDQLRQILGRVIYDSGIPERIRIPELIPDRNRIPEQIRNSGTNPEPDPDFSNCL